MKPEAEIRSEDNRNPYKIGRRKIARSGFVGCGLIYLLMALIGGPFWITGFGFSPSVLAGLIAFGLAIFWLGGLCGYLILKKNRHAISTSILFTVLIVWISVLAGGLTAFFQSDRQFWSADWLASYTLMPIAAFSIWGGIPMIVLAIWAGVSIRNEAV